MSAVTLVVGNVDKNELVRATQAVVQETSPPTAIVQRAAPQAAVRTRAMVKIQEGCDQVCAYCIVPKVRGRERSIPPESIIAEINSHASQGFREVVLTGTQLGTYGFDLPSMDLHRLLERVLSETGVERIRVSSLQAHEITEPVLDLWQDSRLTPHFHIPLQSGSDGVLRRMRRRYDTAWFSAAVDEVRGRYPAAGVTTDIIVGFPGETSTCFADSLEFAAAMRFSDVHVFPYSPRPGTSSFHFEDNVDETEKRERMAEMLALSAESSQRFRESQIGSVRPVLWERTPSPGYWSGLTDNYLRVRACSDQAIGNSITGALLAELDGDSVRAQLLA